jgi:CelD/BcsL family acetyltransferase involved in cellulose biosynthesis
MEAEPLVTRTLMDELKRSNWVQIHKQESHLSVSLPDKYEAYLASLSKKMRTELPYENRRMLKKYQVDFRKVRSAVELQAALDSLFQINTKRWQERGQSGSFGNVEKRLFCQEMAKRFLARGWLDFWLLYLDGQVAAIEYGFRYNGIYYPLWVAIDTDFQAYSAGSVLRTYIIQELIRDGIRVYEFMQGDEPYKLRWGTGRRVYISIFCAAPRSIGAIHMRLTGLHSLAGARFRSIKRRCKHALRVVTPAGLRNIAHKTRDI